MSLFKAIQWVFDRNHGVLHRLYLRRKACHPTDGNRTGGTITLMVSFVVVLMVALFGLIWVQRDEVKYLTSISGVQLLGANEILWSLEGERGEIFLLDDLRQIDRVFDPRSTATVTIRGRIDKRFLAQFVASKTTAVLSLPAMDFREALLDAGSGFERRILPGEPLVISFNPAQFADKDLFVKVLLTSRSTQLRFVNDRSDSNVSFLAQIGRYQKFVDLLAVKRLGSGKQLADIGRIVIAVFSVLLFIFIDSSPECLGLAIFMSLKAFGVAVAQNWLPDGWLSVNANSIMRNFLLCFADIMQLYFFLQLSRLARPRLKPWFLYGGILAGIYTAIMMAGFDFAGINWSQETWRYRNLAIGLACVGAAWPVALFCLRDRLYSRALALSIASIGVFSQIIVPIIVDVQGVSTSQWFQTFYGALESLTPYVFALSTFINMSTLEKRVKNLSQEIVKAEVIQREMALGQAVQKSFFRLPKLPDHLHVCYHHEAAVFVSGDVFYVHWDETHEVLTVILNDVTGHGVQAALKASVCHAISEAVLWEAEIRRSAEGLHSCIDIYAQRVEGYLANISGDGELLAILGCEFHVRRKELVLYRSNGIYPIILQQEHPDADWQVRLAAMQNRQTEVIPFATRGFVLFISDGFLEGSRKIKGFCQYLEEGLNKGFARTSDELRDLILRYPDFSQVLDDRTFLLFENRMLKADAPKQDSDVA